MSSARSSQAVIKFKGVDITKDIKPYFLEMTYTDNEDGETDDLQIKLQDRESLWLQDWLLDILQAAVSGSGHGSFAIQCVIHRLNWNKPGKDETLDTGSFELDAVSASGPPSTVTIKGTSLPYSAPVRQTKKTKAWEKYKLSGIAGEIASNAGMSVMYLSSNNPDIAREEQTDEADIAFLTRLAHNYGLSVKATNKKIVVFDQLTYEKMPSVKTVTRGDKSYTNYKLSTSNADTQYDTCRVRYVNPKGQLIEGIAKKSDYDQDAKEKEAEAEKKAAEKEESSSKKSSKKSAATLAKEAKKAASEAQKKEAQQLEIWYKVESVAEAKALALKMLRMHNKFSKTATFTFPGDPKLVAGANIDLKKFGAWTGKYCIKTAKHSIGTGGYTTSVTLRNTLENY